MVREVVVDGDPRGRATLLQPPAHAPECLSALRHRVGAQPGRRADGERRERVANVVGPEQRHVEGADRLAAAAAR